MATSQTGPGGLPVGKSWQKWKDFETLVQAERAWLKLEEQAEAEAEFDRAWDAEKEKEKKTMAKPKAKKKAKGVMTHNIIVKDLKPSVVLDLDKCKELTGETTSSKATLEVLRKFPLLRAECDEGREEYEDLERSADRMRRRLRLIRLQTHKKTR